MFGMILALKIKIYQGEIMTNKTDRPKEKSMNQYSIYVCTSVLFFPILFLPTLSQN